MTALRRAESPTQRLGPRSDLYFGIQSGQKAMPKLRKFNRGGERFVQEIEVLSAELTEVAALRPPSPASVTIRSARQFDARTDELVAAASKPFRFTIARPREQLNWRFCDARAGRFVVLLAEDADRLLGYAVYRTSERTGDIADALVRPECLDVLEMLLAEALERLRAAGVTSVRCWCARGHPYRSVLTSLGLNTWRRPVYAVFIGMTVPDDQLVFLRAPEAPVHIMAGDTDLV